MARRVAQEGGGEPTEFFHEDTGLHGPRGLREDSVRGGGDAYRILGGDLQPHLSRTHDPSSTPQGQGDQPSEDHDGEENGDSGDGTREDRHGTGGPRGGDRRGPRPGDAAGSTTGPTWNPTARVELKLEDNIQVEKDSKEDAEEVFHECVEAKDHGETETERPGTDDLDSDDYDEYLLQYDGDEVEQLHARAALCINSEGSGDVVQREPSGVNPVLVASDTVAICEAAAKEKLTHKKFTYEDLLEISRLLPLKRAKGKRGSKRGGGDPFEYFLGGMYTYGKFYGLARGSRQLPWTNRYINAFARTKFDGPWSSFVLFRNTATQVHADVHNLPGTQVTSVTFGNFSGGGLWLHEPGADQGVPREDSGGTVLYGRVISTKEQPYSFDGRLHHATQPWEGERWTLSCFTTRGFLQADHQLRDELRELRFPLRGLPLRGDPDQKDFVPKRVDRPKKSTRKNLWKNVNRLAAITTWCTTAAALCLSEDFPLPRGIEAATLYEIGGYAKTIEVTNLDFFAVEPYVYDNEATTKENATSVIETINVFAPTVLWVHRGPPLEFFDELFPVFHKHVTNGRQLVVEAPDSDSIWTSLAFRELLQLHEGRHQRAPGEPDVVRFNGPDISVEVFSSRESLPGFTNYLASTGGAFGATGSEGPSPEEPHGAEVFRAKIGRQTHGPSPDGATGSGGPSPEEPRGAEETYFHDKAQVFVTDQERATGSGGPSPEEPRGAEAIYFEKGKPISPEVRSSLKRLHQNLGHPTNIDLARHLRFAGADATVVQACKRLRCEVCHRRQRGSSAKPATLPNLLEFNQLVAVDAFYVYDTEGEKVELMMAVDVGTGFVSAGLLQGHSAVTMEASFCSIWCNTFGAPGTLIVDLESGLQAGLGRFSEWHGTKIRPIAGQAHWQNGTVERAIRTWKEIWGRLVDEWTATVDEAGMIITATNAAMNTLRRESGFSPSQAVWGRDPRLPEEVKGTPQDDHVEHIISHDRLRAREHSLRISAKEAYFKVQNDARLRRSLLQRSRVAGPELQQGDHVFFYRKPKNNKNWEWHGPGVIIGREGPNTWVSFAGRCHLVAPEHLRTASAEELGAAFTMRTTQDDLQRLLEQDFGDEEIYEGEEMEVDADHVLDPEQLQDEPQLPRGDALRRAQGDPLPHPVTKRMRTKGPPTRVSDGHCNETYMLKVPKTQRGREKALEKELPWSMIPPEQHQGFKDAELRQWEEHVEHAALLPLSVEDSRKVLREKPDRVLNSRFAYRDKLWSRRREQPDIGWKHKARLVISGHRDPDLLSGLPTHAPTISRQGILLLLQILASNLSKGWKGFAGDVTAAFLCGEELQRELYLRQPRTGLGSLHPEQILLIKKPIFGLVDSPAAWWQKFHRTLKSLTVMFDGKCWKVIQCSLDHCIFLVREVHRRADGEEELVGPPLAYLGVHVDDVLLIGEQKLCDVLKTELSECFPIRDWETEKFDYVGSYIEVKETSVRVSQASYASTRLFQVDIDKDTPDHYEATETQKYDNMSLIGALSWMASQTRPDLQVGVSMSQQRQKEPTAGDIRFTNQLARRAMELKECGLEFHAVNLDEAVLLCYHDAGWANVPQNQEDPYYKLTSEEDQAGLIVDGPFARKDAKAKKANSSITSQLGAIYVLTEKKVLNGVPSRGSVLDWRSGACDRVCRSTFAAETMACSTATETGDYIARFMETLLTGHLERKRSRFALRFLTDCRSLYDHLTRDGVPRVPTCKRLSIDLAGIREDLADYGKIAWVPTWAQLADVLTKPLKADQWWKTIQSELKLTFVEEKECTDRRQS